MDIESGANERIKRLVRLRRRRYRSAEGVFVAEGEDVQKALAAGLIPIELYRPEDVGDEIPAVEVFVCSERALAKASYGSDPSAVIGVFEARTRELGHLSPGEPGFVLIAEDLEKPGNFGAILRTADAFGVDAVVLTGNVDPFNPNVIRASRGAVFTVPFAITELQPAIAWCRKWGLRIHAATPHSGRPPWATDLTPAIALMVGAEDTGLTAGAIAAADDVVTIPMLGSINSLNVSVSVAMLAYEVLRQRSS
jgi:TrmH family RNA methyltransferase